MLMYGLTAAATAAVVWPIAGCTAIWFHEKARAELLKPRYLRGDGDKLLVL